MGDAHTSPEIPADDPVAAAAGLARLQQALFGGRRRQPPRLARYLLLQRLSAGGMGVVYRAYDPQLDRSVAVKLIEAEPGDPRTTERRLAEAHALAALSHRNVVRIFDVGTYDVGQAGADPEIAALLPVGGIFLVLELVEGQTLEEWAADGSRTWAEIRDAYVQAGRGLMAAHAAGMVHHDFKPANAVRGHDGRVRVLDFGLAREAASSEGSARGSGADLALTQAGAETRAAGTPLYMAPEQHDGGMTGPATDQFAFCVALFEALYGELPYTGTDVESLGRDKRRGQARLPSSGRRVPNWLGRTLLRGLEPEPSARWPSMEALIRALQRDRRRSRRLRWGLGLGIGAVAALGAVGINRTLRGGTEDLCDAPTKGLRGVWDDARKAQVRSAFEAVPRGYALTTWRAVDGRLDGYRDEWIEQVETTCGARQTPAFDDVLAPLAHACLQQRRRELAAVVDVLAEADEGVVDHAQATMSSLRELGGCIDPAQLRMVDVLPEDPERRAAVEEAQASLVRVGALRLAGRTDDAVALAESIRGRAEALGYPPLRAEALRHLAQARIASGDQRGGLQALREAIGAALATNNHRSAGWAWVDLVFDEVASGMGYEAALEFIPVAERAVARANDAPMQVSWLNAHGGALINAGKVEAGLVILRQAEDLSGENYGSGPDLRLQGNLAMAHGHLEHWEMAEIKQREVLAEILQHLGEGHPDEAIARLNLAAVVFHQGRADETLELATQAVAILRAAYGRHPDIADAYATIAEAHYQLGDLAGAREAALAALEEVAEVDGASETSERGALHMLADLEEREGHLEQAHGYRSRHVALGERLYGAESPRNWLGRLHLAELDARLGRSDQARATLVRAHQSLAERPPGLVDRQWCWLLSEIGYIHEGLGEIDAAIGGHEVALECTKELEVDPQQRALYEKTLAEALVDREPVRAVALMRKALLGAPVADRAEIEAWLGEHAPP